MLIKDSFFLYHSKNADNELVHLHGLLLSNKVEDLMGEKLKSLKDFPVTLSREYCHCMRTLTYCYWGCLRWYGAVHSSTTAEVLHPWTQRRCSSLLRCTTLIWPDTSPRPSGQKLSGSASLKKICTKMIWWSWKEVQYGETTANSVQRLTDGS